MHNAARSLTLSVRPFSCCYHARPSVHRKLLAMTANFRRPPAPRARGFSHLIPVAALLIAGACTFTPPEGPSALSAPPPPAAFDQLTLDQYRDAVAQRIVERN